uniref:Uncharacterized protein n=1 Tax=Arundo donax TaxID=35708 RepID=A0A0A9BDU3_ARUDO
MDNFEGRHRFQVKVFQCSLFTAALHGEKRKTICKRM